MTELATPFYEIPYPLNDTWKMTIKAVDLNDQKGKQQVETDWLLSFKDVFTFDTIQDFWRLYNNVNVLTKVPVGTTYTFFKKDSNDKFTQPSWEDPNNTNGFTYNIYISTRDRYGTGVLDEKSITKMYKEILMLLVGHVLIDDDQINGCTFDRKFVSYKLTIWVKNKMSKSQRLIEDLNGFFGIKELTEKKLISLTVEENKK